MVNSIVYFKPSELIRLDFHRGPDGLARLGELVDTCKQNPDSKFSLFTNQINLITIYFGEHLMPSNLVLIYVNPNAGRPLERCEDLAPYFHKVITQVGPHGGIVPNCRGSCQDCGICWDRLGPWQITRF